MRRKIFFKNVTLSAEKFRNRGVREFNRQMLPEHSENYKYRHQIRSPAGVKAPAARKHARTPEGRARNAYRKCRVAPGRAMKRRTDHDTSAEGQPGENRGEEKSLWRLQAAGRLVLIPLHRGDVDKYGGDHNNCIMSGGGSAWISSADIHRRMRT